jgi:hypothetical protein
LCRLVDVGRGLFTTTQRTTAVGGRVRHVVEQETAADEAGNLTTRSAELNAVGDWHRLVGRSIEVLPRRKADTKLVPDISAVDEDTDDVVVLARNELDPESDGVHCVALVEAGVIRHEATAGIGCIEDDRPDPIGLVNETHGRHSSTGAVVRTHRHEEPWLLSRLGRSERELTDVFGVRFALAGRSRC